LKSIQIMTKFYQEYQSILRGYPLPLAFVDLDILTKNIQEIQKRAQGKTIRVATKSIRCVEIIQRILDYEGFEGLMCYSAREAIFLSEYGFDDLLVAYPAWQKNDIISVCQKIQAGKHITLMVDSLEHIAHLNRIASEEKVRIPLCLDLDLSCRFGWLHFGVYRSQLTSVDKVLALSKQIDQHSHIYLDGIMGYEAQIAGVSDYSPNNTWLLNGAIRFLKKISVPMIQKRRMEVITALTNQGKELRFVNGGGTGSMETTREEDVVTEIAVGSGFYSSGLFDYYQKFRHLPAAGYAIEIVRRPMENIYTCHGGGYVASGSLGLDKLPFVYLPLGAKLLKNEKAGEVQTPVFYEREGTLNIGDPIFMRHSKAGELCEHFNTLLLIENDKVVKEVPTYRGQGHCFL
jgi:D-serine deaminase-like pyridoxal phosphate-dependent protein